MNRAKQLFESLLNDKCGSDLIEYALVASVFALGAIACEAALSARILGEFNLILYKFSVAV